MKDLRNVTLWCALMIVCALSTLLFAGTTTTLPNTIELTVTAGDCITRDLSVMLKSGPVIKKGDIVFNFDLTGSMSADIDAMKEDALTIMNQIAGTGIDAAFGVVSFVDYPHSYSSCGYTSIYGGGSDYAFKVDRAITTNFTLVNSTINNLNIYNGEDGPQDYTRALYETQFLNWRADARKIVVIMGDAPVHDCNFYAPASYGADPGRDEVIGTADDLDFESVVAELASSGIHVVAINCGPGSSAATKSFNYMASQTGGKYFESSDASKIPPAIINLIGEVFSSIAWLNLSVDPESMCDWVSWTPKGFANVKGDVTLPFKVKFCIPEGTAAGLYCFKIAVMGDKIPLAEVPVKIHVGCATPPVADFDSDRNVGLPPLRVAFTDLSKNGPTRWDWDAAVGAFGGSGIHLWDANPVTEYWIPGRHDVQLNVENCGGADALLRWGCDRSFVEVYGPSGYTVMEVKESSAAYKDEPWSNAIDGDLWGWDGTATLSTTGAAAPYAIFSFKDGRTKKLTHFRLMTNTGVGYKDRWVRAFHIDISTDGTQWTTAVTGRHDGNFKIGPDTWDPDGGWWQTYALATPVTAKFVKLVVDNPPLKWAQIGEFEAYEEIKLADMTRSTITVTTPHLNDGKDGSTITLTLKDGSGAAVTGYTSDDLAFYCMDERTAANVFAPFVESSPGVYTTTLTSTLAGDKHVVAVAHGAVVGYNKDWGWTNTVTFIDGLYQYQLKLVESSESFVSEPWSKAIDGIYEGWEGTATVKGTPAYAIFEFSDSKTYAINKFGVQTDNGMDDDRYVNRQARRFRIEVSTTGTASTDFTFALETNIKKPCLTYYRLPKPVRAKYIKLTILTPESSWRQIVEFETHIDATRGLGQPYAETTDIGLAAPEGYQLNQNYPNPFNPVTTISYQIPEASQVDLKIYNTLGQEVITLVNGFMEPGLHAVTWDAAEVPAGVYFCRITAGSYSKMTRMLLLK